MNEIKYKTRSWKTVVEMSPQNITKFIDTFTTHSQTNEMWDVKVRPTQIANYV